MMKNKLPKDYVQPRYSVQLCWLMKHNLIHSIDVIEYSEIAGALRRRTCATLCSGA